MSTTNIEENIDVPIKETLDVSIEKNPDKLVEENLDTSIEENLDIPIKENSAPLTLSPDSVLNLILRNVKMKPSNMIF